jgi:hypothetical protein
MISHKNIFKGFLVRVRYVNAIALYGTVMIAYKNIFKRFPAGIKHVNAIMLHGTAMIAYKNIFKGFLVRVRYVNAIVLYGTVIIAYKNIFKGLPAGRWVRTLLRDTRDYFPDQWISEVYRPNRAAGNNMGNES